MYVLLITVLTGLYKIYGAYDNDSLMHLRYYLDLPNVNKMIGNRRLELMHKLVGETKFTVLCNVFIRNLFEFLDSLYKFPVCVCVLHLS